MQSSARKRRRGAPTARCSASSRCGAAGEHGVHGEHEEHGGRLCSPVDSFGVRDDILVADGVLLVADLECTSPSPTPGMSTKKESSLEGIVRGRQSKVNVLLIYRGEEDRYKLGVMLFRSGLELSRLELSGLCTSSSYAWNEHIAVKLCCEGLLYHMIARKFSPISRCASLPHSTF